MSNSKKLPDLSEKSVESINSGDSRLAANLNINCSEVRRLMNNSSDLIIKYFSSDGHRMAVITCEGMIGKADLANLIFRPLVSAPPKIQDDNEFFAKVCSDMPIAEEQKQVYDYDSLCLYIMSGFAVLLCDGAGFWHSDRHRGLCTPKRRRAFNAHKSESVKRGLYRGGKNQRCYGKAENEIPDAENDNDDRRGTEQDRCFGLLSYRQGRYEYRKRRDG